MRSRAAAAVTVSALAFSLAGCMSVSDPEEPKPSGSTVRHDAKDGVHGPGGVSVDGRGGGPRRMGRGGAAHPAGGDDKEAEESQSAEPAPSEPGAPSRPVQPSGPEPGAGAGHGGGHGGRPGHAQPSPSNPDRPATPPAQTTPATPPAQPSSPPTTPATPPSTQASGPSPLSPVASQSDVYGDEA
ncbi:hypothetical protein IPZ61_06185 [Streptomyces sioyaensis]|uniref:hypothetical protein n=1 Tax=Streptomyces sioyaensis TaxID=67364 RepID=UPI001F44A2F5|nr:hypothetical protein [Streptomyces sioyaensis]MCF3172907.1 hypothetical protein [Streptomyces sioyaensis]